MLIRQGVMSSLVLVILCCCLPKFQRLFHVGRKKLLSKYLAPFEVLARTGAVAHELRLLASMSRMSKVFHVSLPKRYKEGCRGSAPPAVLDNGEESCEIERVLAHHVSLAAMTDAGHIICNGKACLQNKMSG